MKIYVFIGPTISEAEARNWLEAEYMPPVAQGDIASLLRVKPDVIGIIDGYFDQAPSVWHKEILLALSQGVRVFGASSMGALRAAELHPFGMVGIGQIFEWYRDGDIDADDEVAIRHALAEDGYLSLSEAMVNIRKTLLVACRQQVITESTSQSLIELCREMPYWERSYHSLLAKGKKAGLPADELSRLESFIASQRIDQKKEDAIALLQRLAALNEDSLPPQADFSLEKTIFLDALLDLDLRPAFPGLADRIRLDDLVNFARLEKTDFRGLMQKAGTRSLHIRCAKQADMCVSDSEFEIEWKTFLSERHLETDEELKLWLDRNLTTLEELQAYLKESVLEKKIMKIFSSPNNNDLLWQMRMEGGLDQCFQALQDRESKLATNNESPLTDHEELLAFYKTYNGNKEFGHFDHVMKQLGFRNRADLFIEMQKYYLHHSKMVFQSDLPCND